MALFGDFGVFGGLQKSFPAPAAGPDFGLEDFALERFQFFRNI